MTGLTKEQEKRQRRDAFARGGTAGMLRRRCQPPTFNVWPAPSARAFSRASLISLRQRIRSRSIAPAKMEIRAFRSS